ncbi:arginase family protein [Bailinhaonella thermotolerans]|uniref:Arginase family protein n=1 Tax=Bailinhaonella thermotolerans TaxID=1070861 RepID=A0A3A4B3V2_9ACTN|nr:arginase family protein [Bailinhaonella thermotolerans]
MPGARVVRVPVPDGPGAQDGDVLGLDVLAEVAAAARAALASAGDGVVVTAGGDCGVELEPVAAARARHGDALAVVWFDAHGDLNTPESSGSHSFHGMVLRTLLGEGPPALLPGQPLHPGQVVLAGVRALDPGERSYLARTGLRHVGVPDLLASPDRLVEAVAATGATSVYVHIDLDVLDPGTFGSLNYPEPGGLTPAALRAAVRALTDRFPLAGLGVTEYTPEHPDDQALLADLLPALLTR